jgi:hypothetical protein
MDLSAFLKSLPAAASSPLALVAYVLTLLAATLLAMRVARNRNLLRRIDQIPADERRLTLQAEMDTVIPNEISAEEWVTLRTRRLYFSAFAIVCACITLVIVIALANGRPAPDSKLAVHGAGPAFKMPRLQGRTLDACIVSSQFPSQSDLQCVRSAQQLIANAFCKEAGYIQAKQFTTMLQDRMQLSYKLSRDISASGQVIENWLEDNTGGLIFTDIECE